MPSGERIINRLLWKLSGVKTFTTIDLYGAGDYTIGPRGKDAKKSGDIIKISDNGQQGIKIHARNQWINVWDNSDAQIPHASVQDHRGNPIGGKIFEGNRRVSYGAVIVYHGPGNKEKYPTG